MQGALIESVQSPESPAPAHDTEGEAWWEVLRLMGFTPALSSSLSGLLVSPVQHFCLDEMQLLGSKPWLSSVMCETEGTDLLWGIHVVTCSDQSRGFSSKFEVQS